MKMSDKILFTVFPVVALFVGCTSYPTKVRSVKTQLELGVDESTPIIYRAEVAEGKNELLALEEQGRLDQLQGRYLESTASYRKAMAFCDAKSEAPIVDVGDTLRHSLASTYGNDLGLNYPVTAFDQMMLHTLDAFNRLALGEWDNFGVAVRNLVTWRNEANEHIQRDLETLDKELGEKREKFIGSSEYTSLMNKEKVFTRKVSRSTDNIYALYLIALYHEIVGDMANALIAYRDIERISQGLPAVREGISRCEGNKKYAQDEGEVVLFLEEGFIPPKRN